MSGRLREWRERIRGFLFGHSLDGGLESEFAAHLEMAVEDNLRSGMSAEEARRMAAVKFGSRLSAHELAGEQRGLPQLESLVRDLGYATRWMRKSPAFTAVVVLTLALGIGANTALFSLVEAVMLRNLPVRDPQSLYYLSTAGVKGPNGAPPYPVYERFRDHTKSFESMAAVVAGSMTLALGGNVERVWGEHASSSYFQMLGVRAELGRVLTAEDDRLQPPVAVLSYAWWRKRFGGDPAVIGQTVSIDGMQTVIVGVADRRFSGLSPGLSAAITVPFTSLGPSELNPQNWFFDIVARVKPAITPARAQSELEPLYQAFLHTQPDLSPEMRRDYMSHMELLPASRGAKTLRGEFAKPLTILMALVAVVLLVGCSNLANLFLARASTREREFAVRLAIGAGWGRLCRQLLTETLLLFSCGAVLGLLLARWGSQMLAGFVAVGRTPLFIEPHLNGSVLAFTALLTLCAGLVFGVAPTLVAARAKSFSGLHGGGSRGTDSRARIALRQVLVVAQVALSLVLLVGGGLFVRTLRNLNHVDLGFRHQGVLTMRMLPPAAGYGAAGLQGLWSRVLERVRHIPGVRSASLSEITPLSGRDRGIRIVVPGFQAGGGLDQVIRPNSVSEDYFETFGIPLVAGRLFRASDGTGAPPVAILNEAAAKFYFRDRNPLGSTVETGAGARHQILEVVGVVRDSKHMNVRQEAPRFLYVPAAQASGRLTAISLAIHTIGEPGAWTGSVEREIRSANPGIIVAEVLTLKQQVDAALVQERLLAAVGGFFSVLALLLSAVGLYGLLVHVVGRRTAEIGIRMALGADRRAVVWMILERSLWLVGIGLALGIPAALLAGRPVKALLYGLAPNDAATIVGGALVLIASGLLASYLPARRASRIDPLTALRIE